ncbi:MAG: carbohydrate kinase family protein [Patescibacteria group bacterium]|nr:carbohydrate kinase family protein [Patescibacteria group bacterium]
MYDIITLGSATVDVFASTESDLVKFLSSDGEKDFIAYPSGSKLLVSDLSFLIGGGGTNSAVAFSRLGFKTAFLGKLGNDENGQKVLNLLNEENIDFLGKQDGQTGYSIILDSIENDRTILTYKGTNNNLYENDLDFNSLNAKWLYASSMVGDSFETLKKIFFQIKKNNMKLAFNPSNYQAKLGFNELKDILEILDVLILNLDEARLIVGNNDLLEQDLAPKLSQSNNQIIIITDGSKGATCFANNEFYHISPSPHIKIFETTGAGDAFASGFIAGLLRKYDIEDSLKLAMVEAESVISNKGSKEGLLSKEDSFQYLASFKGTIQKHSSPEALNSKSQRVNPEKAFILKDGSIIHSLEELDSHIKLMNNDVFRHHVHEGTNHFATWIRDVFKLEDLANKINLSSSKIAIRVIINDYIKNER